MCVFDSAPGVNGSEKPVLFRKRLIETVSQADHGRVGYSGVRKMET